MDPNKEIFFPFISRAMLKFSTGVKFGFRLYCSSSSTTQLTINGITKDSPFTFTYIPTGTGSIDTKDYQISDFPLFISVMDLSEGYLYGQCYVWIDLLINGQPMNRLAAGYVYEPKSVFYPKIAEDDLLPGHGGISTIYTNDPAANNAATYTVGKNDNLLIIGGNITLVTDATVANRRFRIEFQDSGPNLLIGAAATIDQTAGQTINYVFGKFLSVPAAVINNTIYVSIPDNIILKSGDIIKMTCSNMQAGDNFATGIVRVEGFKTPAY